MLVGIESAARTVKISDKAKVHSKKTVSEWTRGDFLALMSMSLRVKEEAKAGWHLPISGVDRDRN